MCKLEDKKDNVVVEFCEKYSWKIKANMFDNNIYSLDVTNNTGRFTTFRLPSEDIELLTKNVKNNKYLVFSSKTYMLFDDVLDIKLDEVIQLKRAIGGIYVEYFNNMLWITNARGFRQPIKLGKLLKAVNPDFTDKQVSDFVDKFNRYHDYDLSVVSVSDYISEVYNYSHDSSGSIGGSCMTGYGEYFESLENSCPTLKIAYIKDYKNYDYLIGRALLWEAYDSEDNQYKIMDRIYYDCEKTKILLEKYAEANGYYFRKESSGYYEYFYDTTTKTWVKLRLKVELKGSLIGTYTPYMDTFRYYNKNNNTLYNFDGASYTNELTNTDGEAVYTICDVCGDNCTDSYYSDYHNERICENCIEDYRYVESRDAYIHYDNVLQLRDTDTYFLQDDSYLVWVEDRGWYDYADNVHFVVDTEEYYEDTDELYYTEDTCDWYSSNLDLYEYDGVYYSERQEELEQQQEEEK